jgi:hypothetical protein
MCYPKLSKALCDIFLGEWAFIMERVPIPPTSRATGGSFLDVLHDSLKRLQEVIPTKLWGPQKCSLQIFSLYN